MKDVHNNPNPFDKKFQSLKDHESQNPFISYPLIKKISVPSKTEWKREDYSPSNSSPCIGNDKNTHVNSSQERPALNDKSLINFAEEIKLDRSENQSKNFIREEQIIQEDESNIATERITAFDSLPSLKLFNSDYKALYWDHSYDVQRKCTEDKKRNNNRGLFKQTNSICVSSSIIMKFSNIKFLRSESIITKIRQYLTYGEFYNFITCSKTVYNKKYLNEAQAEIIVSGISERIRKKLWMQKCKILYNMTLYKHYFTSYTSCEREINNDINRTFEYNHPFCSNPENYQKLQRVLHAFAVKHPEIGYLQGLNFIAGNLLLQFPEEVFS